MAKRGLVRTAVSRASSVSARRATPDAAAFLDLSTAVVPNLAAEWLETDGLGGFASGTVQGMRTRRYHALLLHASQPPSGRHVLVNGLESWLEIGGERVPLSVQHYAPDAMTGDAPGRIAAFTHEPWPAWSLALAGGIVVQHECILEHVEPAAPAAAPAPFVLLRWRFEHAPAGAVLCVRPLLSGRDPHALQLANAAYRFDAELLGEAAAVPAALPRAAVAWKPYDGVPGVLALADGSYEHSPDWYWHFEYAAESARGLDHVEDLASPGVFKFDVARGEAVLLLAADTPAARERIAAAEPVTHARELVTREHLRRAAFTTPLLRAADAYIVERGTGRTIIAGYPWFGDWGRDTFIALRGLCLTSGPRAAGLDIARDILLEWSGAVSEGMLPNRFADEGDTPEFNAVDASLWFCIVAAEWLDAMRAARRRIAAADHARLEQAIEAILAGYEKGTRHGIRCDADGLLAAGEPGVQLTWMDAKVGGWVVTPRIGKPVEVQALWVNALAAGARIRGHWARVGELARASFGERFWNESRSALYDVVDVDHVAGTSDASLRPNQLFAVGGLPVALIKGERARAVVDAVERELLTPLGLRTLAPGEPGYVKYYNGSMRERDGAYHQGTVWPWLMGAFVEAWLRVRGNTDAAKAEARERFVLPLRAHLGDAGLGHVSEIADAEAPYTPNGCPFQAWSVGELIRMEQFTRPA